MRGPSLSELPDLAWWWVGEPPADLLAQRLERVRWRLRGFFAFLSLPFGLLVVALVASIDPHFSDLEWVGWWAVGALATFALFESVVRRPGRAAEPVRRLAVRGAAIYLDLGGPGPVELPEGSWSVGLSELVPGWNTLLWERGRPFRERPFAYLPRSVVQRFPPALIQAVVARDNAERTRRRARPAPAGRDGG